MGHDLMLLALDATRRVTPLLQTPFDELSGAISPDGHWLAYETNSSGQFEIWYGHFQTRFLPNIRSRDRAVHDRCGPTVARSCSSSAGTAP